MFKSLCNELPAMISWCLLTNEKFWIGLICLCSVFFFPDRTYMVPLHKEKECKFYKTSSTIQKSTLFSFQRWGCNMLLYSSSECSLYRNKLYMHIGHLTLLQLIKVHFVRSCYWYVAIRCCFSVVGGWHILWSAWSQCSDSDFIPRWISKTGGSKAGASTESQKRWGSAWALLVGTRYGVPVTTQLFRILEHRLNEWQYHE